MGPGGSPYVVASQLPQYGPPAMIGLATSAQQDQACLDATEEMDGFLRGRYGNGTGQPFEIVSWGNDLTKWTAYIAINNIAELIGYAPQAGADVNLKTNYYRAVGWPDKPGTGWGPGIQRQSIHPDITPMVPIGSNPNADIPQVITSQQRGWNRRLGYPRTG